MGDDNSSDLFTRDVSAIFHYNSVRLEAGYSQTSWSHIAKDHQLFNTRAPLASLSTYNACGTFFCFSRYPRCYCCTLGPYPIALRQLEVVTCASSIKSLFYTLQIGANNSYFILQKLSIYFY